MCQTAFFIHPLCGCRWLQVTRPCAPGMGLSTCPYLLASSSAGADVAIPPPPVYGLHRKTIKKIKKDFAKSRSRNSSSIFSPQAFDEAVDPALATWLHNVPCPAHDLAWSYDRNCIRMVVGVDKGVRWGLGPSKTDIGIECRCVVM